MSAGHDDGSSLISIGIGTLIPAGFAAAIGLVTAAASWPTPDPNSTGLGATFGNMFAGLAVGLVMGLFVGWFMAWHAHVMGNSDERSEMAAAWGVVPGLIFGAALGPLFAGVMGLFFDQLVSAILFGLFCGPIVGVLAWEIGFFLGNLFKAEHS